MSDRVAPPSLPGSEVDEAVRVPEAATVSGAIRAALDSIRWDDRHRRLARHPLLSGCSRTEIRRVVRAGDDVTIDAGEVVAHEDAIGYWFVLVLEGELAVARQETPIGTVGPGGHVGAEAILGFGPQPATVRAAQASRLFVIGRRDFLSLAYNTPAVQARLFPGVSSDDFVAHVRGLWVEADLAWRRLQRQPEQTVTRSREEALRFFRPQSTGRGSFSRLASRAFQTPDLPGARALPDPPPTLRRRTRVVVAVTAFVTALAIVVGVLTVYHPPIVVVSAGDPVDVTDDIRVRGAAVERPTGRYLLTPVRYDQPSLFGAAVAVITGQTTVPLDQPTSDDTLVSVRAGEAHFRASQRTAAELVLRSTGHDPQAVEVTFRRRQLQGTSAGLVYSLALADMLDPGDLARGRTVAVTGSIDPDGRVQPVAFVWIKAEAAREGGATLFFVPPGQAPLARNAGTEVREVASFADALARLRE